MYQITKKAPKSFYWTDACQNAFDTLKKALASPPVLILPSFDLPFFISTDASNGAIGAVLSQIVNGQEHPIAYWSRQLQKAERNYSTLEREALAVVSAVKHFYPYLYGHTFTLLTDHNPLTSLKNLKDTGGRIARWLLFLQQFDFHFSYRPGKLNNNADVLSRIPQESVATVLAMESSQVRTAQQQDPILSQVYKALEAGQPFTEPTVLARQANRLLLRDGMLCRRYQPSNGSEIIQVVIPTTMAKLVLQHLHDSSGHLGGAKKVKERFYWPGYEQDVEQWVQQCEPCQQRNPLSHNPRAPLGTIRANYPFEKVSWDITGPLPTTI